ncbi:hypothetical protein [Methylobacterium nodulans]|uniref:hypothetical protein n=1 Tax=Methylobacterium nodulans TaxID=114616 RepID=UPI003CC73529
MPQDEVRRQLLEQAREAQARNGGSGGSDDEIVRLCRSLYEAIVLADDANAQLANAFLGPLTDPNSTGFLEGFNKIDRPAPS